MVVSSQNPHHRSPIVPRVLSASFSLQISALAVVPSVLPSCHVAGTFLSFRFQPICHLRRKALPDTQSKAASLDPFHVPDVCTGPDTGAQPMFAVCMNCKSGEKCSVVQPG